jgi:hypothetical protein
VFFITKILPSKPPEIHSIGSEEPETTLRPEPALYGMNLFTSCMDAKHKFSKYPDRAYKMKRLSKEDNGKFIPVALMWPDCGRMQRD